MKVSLHWLRELVELPPTTEALVELLTLAGVEVEGVETRGCAIEKVVVAQILESTQHPNADRLSVCRVDDGSGEPRQIVCGAKNYQVGDKVPLALPGAVLGPDFKIKVGKLRGVESQGMLCSGKELNLPDDVDGLLILPPASVVGRPIGELFPGDTILDLEVTPNRGDLLSHGGIAREVGALTGTKTQWLSWAKIEPLTDKPLSVAIETEAPCYYSALLVRGVKVEPSPSWLRARLEAIGLRSISNVVDVTNYVMMYAGHPTHVFDAAKVEGTIRVREARNGEELLALDGRTYALASDDLVIADDRQALALAGIIGGAESGVSGTTTDVILEMAWFDPSRIRRTARRLGLSTDSSYRFERGTDIVNAAIVSEFAGRLLAQIGGAESLHRKSSASNKPELMAAIRGELRTVSLRQERVSQLLGVEVGKERIGTILTGFGLRPTEGGWSIPSFRPDLSREVDLIEEIARVLGMDAIPAKTQARFAPASATDRSYDRAMTLRRACVAHGLHEARSLTLVPTEPLGLACMQVAEETLQRVKNPMIDDQVVLRPNLLHGLLTAVRTNMRAGARTVRLFEIGRVFSAMAPEECTHLTIVLSGPAAERSWRIGAEPNTDLFDLKGVAPAVLGGSVEFAPTENPALALSLAMTVAGQPVGVAGQLWPAAARELDATAPVLFATIDLGALEKATPTSGAKQHREIPRFPATSRDIALLAPLDLAHSRIEGVLCGAEEPLLASVELFDLFTDPRGEKLPADKKSLAYSLTYRALDRTLTADEVNAVHARLKGRLVQELGVALRE